MLAAAETTTNTPVPKNTCTGGYLHVAVKTFPPYINPCVTNDPECHRPGIEIEVLEKLLSPVDICLNYTMASDSVIKDISSSGSDISLSGYTYPVASGILQDLSHDVGFTGMVYEDSVAFYVKSPTQEIGDFVFLSVVPWQVVLLLFVTSLFANGIQKTLTGIFTRISDPSILPQKEVRKSTKMVTAAWWFAVGLVLVAYGNMLSIHLVKPRQPQYPFDSLEQLAPLLREGKCYIVTTEEAIEDFEDVFPTIARTYTEALLTVAHTKHKPVLVENSFQVFEAVAKQPGCVVGVDYRGIAPLIEPHYCNISVIIDKSLPLSPHAFLIKKELLLGNPAVKLAFSAGSTSALYARVRGIYFREYFSERNFSTCKFGSNAARSGFRPLSMDQTMDMFITLVVGFFLSSIVCCIEIYCSGKRRWKSYTVSGYNGQLGSCSAVAVFCRTVTATATAQLKPQPLPYPHTAL